MTGISINNKKLIFGYHPTIPTLKKIPVNKINEPVVKDRFDFEVDNNEFEHLGDIPLEVVYSNESNTYIIIKGLRIFHEAKQDKKIRKFQCLIVGEVNHDQEAIIARLNHVLATVWPFHVLEQARAIYQTVELFDDAYKHGGNRRSKKFKKQSSIDILSKQFPHKRTRIDDLKRFGNHVGHIGIEGFFRILKGKEKALPIFLIHNANPYLKKMRMRAKIDKKIKDMKATGNGDIEIMEHIGIMIFDVLFGEPKPPNLQKPSTDGNGNDDGDDSGSDDGSSNQQSQKTVGSKNDSQEFNAVPSKKVNTMIEAYNDFLKEAQNVKPHIKLNQDLTPDETEKIFNMGENVQYAFEKFWILFITAGVLK